MSESQPEEPIAIESAPVAVQPVAQQSHTRTILEIVGGIIAVGLIFFSGAAGFILGHVTAQHDGHRGGPSIERRIELRGGPGLQQGPSFQQPMPAQPQG